MGPAPHWVFIVLTMLSVYRLTRLVVRDAFPLIAGPREWIQEKWDPFDDEGWTNWAKYTGEERQLVIQALKKNRGIPEPTTFKKSIAYLVTCAWCTSVWIAAATVLVEMIFTSLSWQWAILLGLASSAITGLIAQREPSS